MSNPTYAESLVVRASPEALYAMVSDVTRTGEWSPVCTSCRWDEGHGPEVGGRFTGRNEASGRTWESRNRVVAADPGRAFAWEVGKSFVRWGYTFAPVADGTEVTETWEFLPDGVAMFHTHFGDDAPREIEERTRDAHEGIPATLTALKRIAEGG